MLERELLNPDTWYRQLENIATMPPAGRYGTLVQLHQKTIDDYFADLIALTPALAGQKTADGRTRAEIVGHISAWEEWQIQVFKSPERLSKVKQLLELEGYQEPETGDILNFTSVNQFNAYQEEKCRYVPWVEVRAKAMTTASRLHACFQEDPSTGLIYFLESTPLHIWKVDHDLTLVLPAGWYLWMVSLEHEAVEHTRDLRPELAPTHAF